MVLSFRPRLLPTVAALLGLCVTVWACAWQYGRGLEKDRIEAERAAADDGARVTLGSQALPEQSIRYRRVVARGTFLPEFVVYLDNQVRGASTGVVVFSPLRLGNGPMHVLVKRGWLAAPADRRAMPAAVTPTGEVEVEGTALPPNSRFLELSSSTQSGPLWQNVTLDRVASATGLAFQPLILEQTSKLEDGLVRDWPRPSRASAKHYGYAFQWGAMAVSIVILYVVLNVRRPPSPPAP